MNVWNGIDSYPRDAPAAVATIGNYDGVHLGHREILRRVLEDARSRGTRSLVISFTPHPMSVVAPDRPLRLLQTRRQKLQSLDEARVSDLLLLDFDAGLAALDGEQFLERMLLGRVSLAAAFVGENFRFGHDRQGNLELLQRIGARRGFDVYGVAAVQVDGTTVSSSTIRAAILEGAVERAAKLLGRPFSVSGSVVRGAGRGRTLDCPTANLDLENDLIPERGVYITETLALAARFPSVTNVGIRPTVGGKTLTVETHLLDVEEDLYDERIEVRFLARLRDEMRFEGLPQLADQIARDRAAAESYFQNRRVAP